MSKKTPKKSNVLPDSVLSPVSPPISSVIVSPGRSPGGGNLTGSARKVRDSAADWHNYIDKWTIHRTQGAEVLSQVANIKLQIGQELEQYSGDEGHDAVVCEMPAQLDSLIEKLLTILTSMEKIVLKLQTITTSLQGVSKLEWYQQNESFCEEPLFKTWMTPQFYDTSAELLSMYQRELILKETIIRNVAHTKGRDLLMTYTAAWIHEPYIEERAVPLLESFLHETGHR